MSLSIPPAHGGWGLPNPAVLVAGLRQCELFVAKMRFRREKRRIRLNSPVLVAGLRQFELFVAKMRFLREKRRIRTRVGGARYLPHAQRGLKREVAIAVKILQFSRCIIHAGA